MQRILSATIPSLLIWALAAPPATAETELGLYLGASFTNDSFLDGEVGGLPAAPRSASWDDSIEGGIRGGYWFDGSFEWLGLGYDMGYYRPEVSTVGGVPITGVARIHLIPLTPLVMVRAPLFQSDEYTHGRIQPYAAVGPGLFVSVLTSDTVSGREVGFDLGVDFRVGVTMLIRPNWGFFTEYRYTDLVVNNRDSAGDKIKTTLESDHLNVGVTFRF